MCDSEAQPKEKKKMCIQLNKTELDLFKWEEMKQKIID